MLSQIRPAIVSFVALTVVTGLVYPAIVTGFAKVAAPNQAEGSLIVKGDKTLGSELIAQGFTAPKYFWPRPSGAGYNGAGASGTNLGPNNPALVDAVKSRIDALHAADPENTKPIPVELVTASASGLDPHLSPTAMDYQAARVAKARGLPVDVVQSAIAKHTTGRLFGILGEPTVNVLLVNLELDHAIQTASTHPEGADHLYRGMGFIPTVNSAGK